MKKKLHELKKYRFLFETYEAVKELEIDDMFDMLLGDDLQGRKDFISRYGHDYIELADIS